MTSDSAATSVERELTCMDKTENRLLFDATASMVSQKDIDGLTLGKNVVKLLPVPTTLWSAHVDLLPALRKGRLMLRINSADRYLTALDTGI